MTLVIGTDEAGYGPNLGPLVVAATAWRVAADAADAERVLATAVAEALADHEGPLWADSKRIYRGGDGFAALERGALVALTLAGGGLPRSWPELAVALVGDRDPEPTPPETARLASTALPADADAGACLELTARLGPRLTAGAATLVAVRCRVIQPAAFNALLDAGLNKSDILSHTTLQLAADLAARGKTPPGPSSTWPTGEQAEVPHGRQSPHLAAADVFQSLPDAGGGEPTLVWCDRHGGRRRYAPLLARHFAEPLVRVVEETASHSAYELPAAACRVEFDVGGESRTPVAVASMTAKYVRELAMRAFNAHWSALDATLAPTAGYPVDAARWRRQATPTVTAAGIPWDAVWRRA